MLQREEKEPPSDFQDYTLLALVAVSAFLSSVNLGDRHGLVALARKYDQDVEPLQQVLNPSPRTQTYTHTYMHALPTPRPLLLCGTPVNLAFAVYPPISGGGRSRR
jgi:hypothetical protein